MKIFGVLFLFFVVATSYSQIPTDGLVAWYPFTSNANDQSGNGHDGTPYPGVTLSPDRFGTSDNAYAFDGSTGRIELGPWFSLNIFSISLWVNSGSWQNTYADIIDNNHTDYRSWAIQQKQSSTNTMQFGATIPGTDTDTVTLSTGIWQHLVAVKDSQQVRFYLDGVMISAKLFAGGNIPYDGTQQIGLGRWYKDGNVQRFWNGAMDDIRLYNRAITSVEVDSLYHEGGWPIELYSKTVDPDTLSFGIVEIGSNKSDSVTVTNTGILPIIIDTVTLDNAYFTTSGGNDTLQPMESRKYGVTFTPGFIGGTFGHLVIQYNGGATPDTVTLMGAGSVSGISFNKWWIYYGKVLVGQSKVDSVIITNHGGTPLVLGEILCTNPQFSIESPFVTIAPGDSESIPITFTPTGDDMAIGEITAPFEGTGSPLHVIVFGQGYEITTSVSVSSMWNLVSNPVSGIDDAVSSLYPNAISPAFSYSGLYISESRLENGVGYWLKFARDTVYNFVGFPVTKESVDVITGWNLIGSLTTPIGVNTLTTIPGGITSSEIFGYESGYIVVDTIRPGKAYWIKVNQDGQLILDASASISMLTKNRIKIVASSELPPPAPGEGMIAEQEVPKEYSLEQAYPSPFNPTTTIKYSLPADSRVSLKVYNVLGQVVATLSDEIQSAGFQTATWVATGNASGIYFYRLDAVSLVGPTKSFSQVRKAVLLR